MTLQQMYFKTICIHPASQILICLFEPAVRSESVISSYGNWLIQNSYFHQHYGLTFLQKILIRPLKPSNKEIDAMVLLSPQESNLVHTNFVKRTLSAAIGGPIAVGAVMLGSPYVDILAILLLGTLLWEWSKMSALPLSHPINGLVILL